ncbi:MAG: hypothetical protein NT157_02520 [Candidatus Micrarchaeota archaeon]|nr:hypothetical protein [Candidatus Micrarchaeota archaeon]
MQRTPVQTRILDKSTKAERFLNGARRAGIFALAGLAAAPALARADQKVNDNLAKRPIDIPKPPEESIFRLSAKETLKMNGERLPTSVTLKEMENTKGVNGEEKKIPAPWSIPAPTNNTPVYSVQGLGSGINWFGLALSTSKSGENIEPWVLFTRDKGGNIFLLSASGSVMNGSQLSVANAGVSREVGSFLGNRLDIGTRVGFSNDGNDVFSTTAEAGLVLTRIDSPVGTMTALSKGPQLVLSEGLHIFPMGATISARLVDGDMALGVDKFLPNERIIWLGGGQIEGGAIWNIGFEIPIKFTDKTGKTYTVYLDTNLTVERTSDGNRYILGFTGAFP